MTARIKTCDGCYANHPTHTLDGRGHCGICLENTQHTRSSGVVEWRPSPRCPKPRWRDADPGEIDEIDSERSLRWTAATFVLAVLAFSVASRVWP